MLGEEGGTWGAHQTSPDLGLLVNRGRGLVLVESKLTEDSFYKCSAWKHKGSRNCPAIPIPTLQQSVGRCERLCKSVPPTPPSLGTEILGAFAPVVDVQALASLPHCPAMKDGFQLLRQQALAEGIAKSGRYDLVMSVVAVDERNDEAKLPSGGAR